MLPTHVQTMASVMKSPPGLSVIVHQDGPVQPVLSTLMNVRLTLAPAEESVKTLLMALSAFVLHSGLGPPVSWMLMSVREIPVLMLILAEISLVDITVTASQDGQEKTVSSMLMTAAVSARMEALART